VNTEYGRSEPTTGTSGRLKDQPAGERPRERLIERGAQALSPAELVAILTIQRRTLEYARDGIYVLWLLQWTPKLDARRYTPRLWEKWVHAAYFGRVYYWIEGLTVVSYHFDPNHKTVPKATWYSPKGKKITAGGYSRRSKRYRTAIRGRTFNLATDFGPRNRDWWEGKDITIPAAKLYIDRHRLSIPAEFYEK
jgi:competence protein CoiA